MNKYTPAPWTLSRKTHDISMESFIINTRNVVICAIPASHRENARFLSAAPAMYEALKKARLALVCCVSHARTPEAIARAKADLAQAEAAIYKATGEVI